MFYSKLSLTKRIQRQPLNCISSPLNSTNSTSKCSFLGIFVACDNYKGAAVVWLADVSVAHGKLTWNSPWLGGPVRTDAEGTVDEGRACNMVLDLHEGLEY